MVGANRTDGQRLLEGPNSHSNADVIVNEQLRHSVIMSARKPRVCRNDASGTTKTAHPTEWSRVATEGIWDLIMTDRFSEVQGRTLPRKGRKDKCVLCGVVR